MSIEISEEKSPGESVYFHGSFDEIEIGAILQKKPGGYVDSADCDLESIFERLRPKDKISRAEAVYLIKDPDDIDAAGGYTDFVYIVQPVGKVEKSDLAWYSYAQGLVEEGASQKEIEVAVRSYWDGQKFTDPAHSLWEFRVQQAVIVANECDLPAKPQHRP